MKGITRTGAVVNIVAAATSTVVYTVSTGRSVAVATPATAGGVVFVLNRLWIYSRQAATVQIRLGELVAAVFTDRFPWIDVLTTTLHVFGEGSLLPILPFMFTSSLIAQSSAAGAVGAEVQIMAEVIEYPDFLRTT